MIMASNEDKMSREGIDFSEKETKLENLIE